MANFRQTSEALIEWQANTEDVTGSHIDPNVAAGVHSNIVVGEIPFDANHHDPFDVDHMSLMGAATGELYVAEVLPERPMAASVAIDATFRAEHPVLTRSKSRLAQSLSLALEHAFPGMSDQVETHRLISRRSPATRARSNEILIDSHDQDSYADAIKHLAYNGLTFVVTDGRQIRLSADSLRRSQAVAVKINHILERVLPVGAGSIPVWNSAKGRMEEFDTSSPKKVVKKNAELEQEHMTIVSSLQEAGMPVAEVVTNTSRQRFDVSQADKNIARAVRTLAR